MDSVQNKGNRVKRNMDSVQNKGLRSQNSKLEAKKIFCCSNLVWFY